MKIVFVSDDEESISRHFGRAKKFMVYSTLDGKVTGLDVLDKVNHCASQGKKHHHHGDGYGHGHEHGLRQSSRLKHRKAIEPIKECDVVISRGMGRGIYETLVEFGLQPVITDITAIDTAIDAVLNGTMVNHTDRIH